jgi:AcrR family transcriptional regulator
LENQRKSESNQTAGQAKREQRKEKILDSAAELMLRWGYNKTTIDDIARSAGVAKATIYLYWKTREDLFVTLMKREFIHLIKDIQELIQSDPEGGTIHGFIKHSMLVTLKNPLMKAVFLRDTDLVGEWLHKEYSSEAFAQQIAPSIAIIEHFQSRGMIREDIDAYKLIYMLDSVSMGFLVIDQYMPEGFTFSDEEKAEMTSEAIRKIIEPPSSTSQMDEQAKKEIANGFISALDMALAIWDKKGQEEDT